MFGTIIPFIFLILVVVFVHEYGHYYYAKKCGALGGKVMGAGGGGYFIFYVPPALHLSFRKKMLEKGLVELNWNFDFEGVTKIFSG